MSTWTVVDANTFKHCILQNKANGKLLEQVQPFAYLGSVFTANGRGEKEVKRRLVIVIQTRNYLWLHGYSITQQHPPPSNRTGKPFAIHVHDIHIHVKQIDHIMNHVFV